MYKSLIALSFLALSISASPIVTIGGRNTVEARCDTCEEQPHPPPPPPPTHSKPPPPSPIHHPHTPKFAPTDNGLILNFALTLEFLIQDFYKCGLERYTEADFIAAGFEASLYAEFQGFYASVQAQISFLTSSLSKCHATPVVPGTYDWSYSSVSGFVALRAAIDGVGLSAYLDAALRVTDNDFISILANVDLNFDLGLSLVVQFCGGFELDAGLGLDLGLSLGITGFPLLTIDAGLGASGGFEIDAAGELIFSGARANALSLNLLIDVNVAVYAAFYVGLDTYYAKAIPCGQNNGDYKVEHIPEQVTASLDISAQVWVGLFTEGGISLSVLAALDIQL